MSEEAIADCFGPVPDTEWSAFKQFMSSWWWTCRFTAKRAFPWLFPWSDEELNAMKQVRNMSAKAIREFESKKTDEDGGSS